MVVVNIEDPEKTKGFTIPVTIENNEYLNDLFKVTYTDAISVPSTEAGSSITKNYTITNTYSPRPTSR